MAAGIEGRVAVVTGGASGIGRATALAFADEGAKVAIVTARSITAAAHLVEEIERLGGEATFVQCDVTDEPQVAAMVEAVVARFGSIDFAFNNAGVGPDGVTIPFSPLVDLAETDWDAVVDTNLKGVFLCMKHELRRMREQCSGVIVNTSSTGGLNMKAGFGAYGPSKAAVIALIETGRGGEQGQRHPGQRGSARGRRRVRACPTAAELHEGRRGAAAASHGSPRRRRQGRLVALFGRRVLRDGQRHRGGRRA